VKEQPDCSHSKKAGNRSDVFFIKTSVHQTGKTYVMPLLSLTESFSTDMSERSIAVCSFLNGNPWMWSYGTHASEANAEVLELRQLQPRKNKEEKQPWSIYIGRCASRNSPCSSAAL